MSLKIKKYNTSKNNKFHKEIGQMFYEKEIETGVHYQNKDMLDFMKKNPHLIAVESSKINVFVYLIFSNEKLIGFIEIEISKKENSILIRQIHIDKNHRKNGFATECINILLKENKNVVIYSPLTNSSDLWNKIFRKLYENKATKNLPLILEFGKLMGGANVECFYDYGVDDDGKFFIILRSNY